MTPDTAPAWVTERMQTVAAELTEEFVRPVLGDDYQLEYAAETGKTYQVTGTVTMGEIGWVWTAEKLLGLLGFVVVTSPRLSRMHSMYRRRHR